MRDQGPHARLALGVEGLLRQRAGLMDRAAHAAAGARDVLARATGDALLEIDAALAGMDDVGVAIDQPGGQQPPGLVMHDRRELGRWRR